MKTKSRQHPTRARPAKRRWLGLAAAGLSALLVSSLIAMAAGPSLIAVYRPSTGEWFLRSGDGSANVSQFGGPGDVPVVADYEGRGQSQLAVFRPTTREWFLRSTSGGTVVLPFGGEGDQPIPGDYLGLSRAQVAVFRPSTREWFIRRDDNSAEVIAFGGPGDQPVPADYFGEGRLRVAVFRPNSGEWFLRNANGETVPIPWGGAGDKPMPGDYFGLRRAQVAVFRPSTAEWFIRNDDNSATRIQFGGPDDVPVLADYDGSGRVRISVFRPSTGEWFLRGDDGNATRVAWGTTGDIPVPASYAATTTPPPPPPAPAAPSNLVATVNSQTQITLTWTDNSNNESGFRIERRTGGGAFAEIASPAANATSHADSGLTPGTGYTYRVRAVNSSGPSAYSNEAGATTQSAPPPLTLAADIQPIFQARCATAGCHGQNSPQMGLELSSAAKSFELLVNHNSAQSSKKRVLPGDPANSFLFEKISQDRPSAGARMPFGGPPLSAEDIEKIRLWIQQGARA